MFEYTYRQVLAVFLLANTAACNDRFEEFKAILDEYPELAEWQDENGNTLLHQLTRDKCDIKYLMHLIDCGANVSRRTNFGDTALEFAIDGASAFQSDSMERITILLQAGADPDATMRSGFTALQKAIALERKDIAEILLSHGADAGKGSADLPSSSTAEVVSRSKDHRAWDLLLERYKKLQ